MIPQSYNQHRQEQNKESAKQKKNYSQVLVSIHRVLLYLLHRYRHVDIGIWSLLECWFRSVTVRSVCRGGIRHVLVTRAVVSFTMVVAWYLRSLSQSNVARRWCLWDRSYHWNRIWRAVDDWRPSWFDLMMLPFVMCFKCIWHETSNHHLANVRKLHSINMLTSNDVGCEWGIYGLRRWYTFTSFSNSLT